MVEASRARRLQCLAGTLATQPIAALLATAATRSASGTFYFRHGERSDSLTIRSGRVALVKTCEPVAYLGGILYEHAVIDAAALNDSLLEVATRRRLHGAVLLERGLVTQAELDAALAEQTCRRVNHLFALPDSTPWTFREGIDELRGASDEDRPALDPWLVIWRGLRERPPQAHLERTMALLERGAHLRDVRALDRLGLSAEERAVCERLAQPTTLAKLVASSGMTRERTLLLVYLLALGGCVVRVQVGPVTPQDLGTDGVRERARDIDGEDPCTVLGLGSGASADSARAAYFRLARLWHPDQLGPELDAVRGECEHVLARLGDALRALTCGPRSGLHAASAEDADDAFGGAGAPGARPTMRDVDEALARGDSAGARALAVALSAAGTDGPTARSVIAWCGAQAGGADAQERALAALQAIVAGDPDCSRAFFYRAQILKRLGRTECALRDFRKVARLDPSNLDAVRELRLHAMRARNGSGEHAPPEAAPTEAAPPLPGERGDGATLGSGLRRFVGRLAGR